MPNPSDPNSVYNGGGGIQLWGPTKNNKPPPDFNAAATAQADASRANTNAQTNANRPNQTNAFGSSVNWTQNPDGTWTQNQSFGGPLGGLSGSLQGQAAANMGTPFDLSQFGTLGNGDDARKQAIDSAYSQATSRLDPRFARDEEALRTRLLNEGLDPSSEAAHNAMSDFGQMKNDAYSSAMNGAIQQGTAAGDSVFRNNLNARQQALSEALGARGLPMQDLLSMAGLLGQQSFMGAGRAETPDILAALGLQTGYDQAERERSRQQMMDTLNGFGGLLGLGAKAFL